MIRYSSKLEQIGIVSSNGTYWEQEKQIPMLKVCTAAIMIVTLFAAIGETQSDDSNPFGGNIWVTSIAIDPIDTGYVFIGTRNGGIFSSSNGGEEWLECNSGLTEKWITSLFIDPSNPSTIYAGGLSNTFKSTIKGATWNAVNGIKGAATSVAIQNDKLASVFISTGSGLWKSNDGGPNWREVRRLQKSAGFYHLATNSADPGFLYAQISISPDVTDWDSWSGNGLYRTKDQGESWEKISSHLISVLAFVPNAPRKIYAGTNESILKTEDGGETWQEIANAIPKSSISNLAIDNKNPSVIYASTGYRFFPRQWSASRIYKSTDAGDSWRKISDFPVNEMAVDPLNSKIIYAATPGGGIYKSVNAGDSWKPSNSGLLSEQ
jgi:photosystem II stability/assembly factor-like uncharacterized protein